MGTVTIAATYGAGGSVIAPAVAARLGLPFIERAIPIDVAKNINASMEEMLADDVEYTSRAGCVLERIMASSGLFVGVAARSRGAGRRARHQEDGSDPAPARGHSPRCELWFNTFQRRCLRRGDFPSADALEAAIVAFIATYNRLHAHPDRWTYSGDPLVA